MSTVFGSETVIGTPAGSPTRCYLRTSFLGPLKNGGFTGARAASWPVLTGARVRHDRIGAEDDSSDALGHQQESHRIAHLLDDEARRERDRGMKDPQAGVAGRRVRRHGQ